MHVQSPVTVAASRPAGRRAFGCVLFDDLPQQESHPHKWYVLAVPSLCFFAFTLMLHVLVFIVFIVVHRDQFNSTAGKYLKKSA